MLSSLQEYATASTPILAEAFGATLPEILAILGLLAVAVLSGLLTIWNVVLVFRLRMSTWPRVVNFLAWCVYAWGFSMEAFRSDTIFPKDTPGWVKDEVDATLVGASFVHFIALMWLRRRTRKVERKAALASSVPPPLPIP